MHKQTETELRFRGGRQHCETGKEYNHRMLKGMSRWELYREALLLWGENAQVGMAIEEMAELTKALMKNWRKREEDHVIEEIADVEIMIEQLKVIFGVKAVNEIREQKLRRLQKRIAEASK